MPGKFEVTIHTDNDVFDPPTIEVARILRKIASELESGADDFGMYRTLSDINGNDVGRAKMHANDAERARRSINSAARAASENVGHC